MDPKVSLQDVIQCHLCEALHPSKHCDICHIYLCEACVSDHLSVKSKEHYIVSYELRGSTPKCQIHTTKTCKELCKQCNTPICSQCVTSREHHKHDKEDILKMFEIKKERILKDVQDLEKSIYPNYLEAATNIPVKRAYVHKHSMKLKSSLNKEGEALHSEIDTIIQRMQSKIDDMRTQHLTALGKQERSINHTVSEITQIIEELKGLPETNDICLISKYKSRNEEFRRLLAQSQMTLQTSTPEEIREQIYQQVGSLSFLAIACLREPQILTEIQTGYTYRNRFRTVRSHRHLIRYQVRNVSCLSDTELWTCGFEKIMRLYNLQGESVKSVETKSGNKPWDIAVTRSGDLIYADYWDRSINLVKTKKIKKLITLQGWRPTGVCSTSSGHLLVIMNRDDKKRTKVVRYSGSTEKQKIQWDDQGKPLYSSGNENKNLDICVADSGAHALVVVNAAGELRFKYKGHSSATKRVFYPRGITIDRHGIILIADYSNNSIHMVNSDGHFLRYIDYFDLKEPIGLCVDTRDNLFVAEFSTGKVKKIQYYK